MRDRQEHSANPDEADNSETAMNEGKSAHVDPSGNRAGTQTHSTEPLMI
jgi:hypothetical protein